MPRYKAVVFCEYGHSQEQVGGYTFVDGVNEQDARDLGAYALMAPWNGGGGLCSATVERDRFFPGEGWVKIPGVCTGFVREIRVAEIKNNEGSQVPSLR